MLPSFCPWLAFLIVRNLIPLVLRLIPVQAPRMERLPPPGGCRRVEAPSLRGSWPRGIAARLCLLVCIPSPTRLACCPSTRLLGLSSLRAGFCPAFLVLVWGGPVVLLPSLGEHPPTSDACLAQAPVIVGDH